MNRILFLDFDGVLNSDAFLLTVKNRDNPIALLSRRKVALLNKIVEETGAKVVISSHWRYEFTIGEIRSILEELGFKGQIIGITPIIMGMPRGYEIHGWLSGFPGKREFVILDDQDNMDFLSPHLIQTNSSVGLTDENVQQVINKFMSV